MLRHKDINDGPCARHLALNRNCALTEALPIAHMPSPIHAASAQPEVFTASEWEARCSAALHAAKAAHLAMNDAIQLRFHSSTLYSSRFI